MDTETRTTFTNREGIPRILEGYYAEERKATQAAWTRGLELARMLHTTTALTDDAGVETHWILVDGLPINYGDIVTLSAKHGRIGSAGRMYEFFC